MGKTTVTGLVAHYLDRLHEIHRSEHHTPELSYRAALENLLAAIAKTLDPPVTVTAELADTGDGRPDFGFFEAKSGNSRGVVEVKKLNDDVPQAAEGDQVSRYWNRYGYVLVTNYRDFLLVVRNANGNGNRKPRIEARCQLAPDPEAFWRSKPHALAAEKAEELVDFLIGVMRRAATITRPRDLAEDLARHAREAKRRLERHDIAALQPLQLAMESALGLHFTGPQGQHFFRSSLVQTIFYGLFSGWMLWRQGKHQPGAFEWQHASDYLALPLIADLYEEIARNKRLKDFDLREPLDWATSSLNRVSEPEFFNKFDEDHAITLFYEPFLQAFDPELRKQLGVWYTPPEIVQYMVGRVDQLLKSELNLPDGLADPNVYVLDPCCGTGSYLLAVAKTIHNTLTSQGHGSLAASQVKKALTTRIFGFEILPAPYVVSHLQLGILLRQLGTSLSPSQRSAVFLTNALTGWEPAKGVKATPALDAFRYLLDEQEAAATVKRESPILVILGNPPYNGFAGVAQEEERDLLAPYFDGIEEFNVQVRALNDLYIRFYRLAERRIAEVGGRGIVSFISNFSWLDGQSHPVMRKRLLTEFDQIWIDNCNGDKYRTGKRTPDGKPDQSMFTTDSQPIGIQVGTAIATMIKRASQDPSCPPAQLYYRDLWGHANAKRQSLLDTLQHQDPEKLYNHQIPTHPLRYIFTPGATTTGYAQWPRLPALIPMSYPGVQTSRDELLVDIDRDKLILGMMRYFSPSVSDEQIREECPCAMTEGKRFLAAETRRTLINRGFLADRIVRFSYRPFDDRWLYWEPEGKLLDEKRSEYFPQVFPGNIALTAAGAIRKGMVEGPMPVIHLGCRHLLERGANIYPALHATEGLRAATIDPNVAPDVLGALGDASDAQLFEPDAHTYTPAALALAESLFYHLLAILWSPGYRKENEAALRQDWPRIPIPADPKILQSSAALGRFVADLLLPDRPVPGVTTGQLRHELKHLAIPSKLDKTPIEEPADTKVTAGWGFRGQKNAVMCGQGKRLPHPSPLDPRPQTLDPAALDLFINDSTYWSNVPADVYAMTIGGYPVIKKWLSYREYKVLGRPLHTEELTYITQVVRRLKALLLLSADLDSNYRSASSAPPIALSK